MVVKVAPNIFKTVSTHNGQMLKLLTKHVDHKEIRLRIRDHIENKSVDRPVSETKSSLLSF